MIYDLTLDNFYQEIFLGIGPTKAMAAQPRPNVLPQRDAPSAPTQPLPRGQAQSALVQEQGGLPVSFPTTYPTSTSLLDLPLWCRFDDDNVTPSTLAGVLGASTPIYMASYVKRRLDYEPHITRSRMSCLQWS
jgi:hypothetical protein